MVVGALLLNIFFLCAATPAEQNSMHASSSSSSCIRRGLIMTLIICVWCAHLYTKQRIRPIYIHEKKRATNEYKSCTYAAFLQKCWLASKLVTIRVYILTIVKDYYLPECGSRRSSKLELK